MFWGEKLPLNRRRSDYLQRDKIRIFKIICRCCGISLQALRHWLNLVLHNFRRYNAKLGLGLPPNLVDVALHKGRHDDGITPWILESWLNATTVGLIQEGFFLSPLMFPVATPFGVDFYSRLLQHQYFITTPHNAWNYTKIYCNSENNTCEILKHKYHIFSLKQP